MQASERKGGESILADVARAGVLVMLPFLFTPPGLARTGNSAEALNLDRAVIFDISPQDLGSALIALSRQAHVQILIESDIQSARHAPALRGSLPIRKALATILHNTEYRYQTVGMSLRVWRASDFATPGVNLTAGRSANSTIDTEAFVSSGDGRADAAAPSENESSMSPELHGELEQVLVTAQKRSEDIQEVPLSINVLSGQRMNEFNYTQLSDFASTIPGLQVDSAGLPGINTITLRGISTGNLYGSTTTATYVNDSPISTSGSYSYGASYGGLDLLPYDLDHVEVLKGPQGTLYGASSMGGLLKYVLNSPSLSKDSFRVGTGVSTIDGGVGVGYDFRAYGNLVLAPEVLAASISGDHTYTPGYIRNTLSNDGGVNHGNQDAGRIAFDWHPVERLNVQLSGLINHSDTAFGATIPTLADGQPQFGRYDAYWVFRNGAVVNDKLYSSDIVYDFGSGKITSITSYSNSNTKSPGDASLVPGLSDLGLIPVIDDIYLKKLTQEIRWTSPFDQPFQWGVGAFFTREVAGLFEKIDVLDPVTEAPNEFDPLEDLVRSSVFKERAAFGNATYRFSDRIDISAGVRYSHNDQSVSDKNSGISSPEYQSSDSSVTYSASSRYHFTSDAMVYIRVATGYRPGGSNIGLSGAPPDFGPDKLTNYEIGVKSEFLDKRVLVDATAFYIDWKKIQIAEYTNTALALIYTGNGASAISEGFELSSQYSPLSGLRLGLNVGYTNAKLTADAPAVGGVNGDRLPLSPQWSGSLTADWARQLNDRISLTTGVMWRVVGDRITDFAPTADSLGGANYLHVSSYNSLDFAMGVSTASWTARVFAKNVGNAFTYLRYTPPFAAVMQPRTIGLSLDFQY